MEQASLGSTCMDLEPEKQKDLERRAADGSLHVDITVPQGFVVFENDPMVKIGELGKDEAVLRLIPGTRCTAGDALGLGQTLPGTARESPRHQRSCWTGASTCNDNKRYLPLREKSPPLRRGPSSPSLPPRNAMVLGW
ncbi:hypothetical protein QR685DRAFT_440313 [Neurospora intermedia]|uniref:Uncharacterized protein n=1 Tax=Neurospora intermedia TaxID=5142 RepID=A0ABR3DJI1_NEUIN